MLDRRSQRATETRRAGGPISDCSQEASPRGFTKSTRRMGTSAGRVLREAERAAVAATGRRCTSSTEVYLSSTLGSRSCVAQTGTNSRVTHTQAIWGQTVLVPRGAAVVPRGAVVPRAIRRASLRRASPRRRGASAASRRASVRCRSSSPPAALLRLLASPPRCAAYAAARHSAAYKAVRVVL